MKLLTIIIGFVNVGLMGVIYLSINGEKSPLKNTAKVKAIAQSEIWKVDRVADADTITVSQGSDRRRVRFCGIDAPETAHKAKEVSQPGGEIAKETLEKMLRESDDEVAITFVERDRYGRWIGEIFLNPGSDREIFVNEELVKLGLAWPYKQYWGNCPNRDAIAAAEAIAQNPIWKQPGNIPPWEWRKK